MALLRADVVYLRGGAPTLYGRDAARTLLAATSSPPGTSFLWSPLGGELSADHRSGYTFGVAVRAVPDGKPVVRVNHYIAFWQRDAASSWRVAAYSEVGAAAPTDATFTAEQLAPPALNPALPRRAVELLAKLRETDSSFSDLADRMGVAEAFTTYVAPDGAVFRASQLVVGPRSVRDIYSAQGRSTALTWRPIFAGAAASGDLGFTVGDYVATLRGPSGAAVQQFGKYLTVWKRQRDGNWRFMIDGGSPNPARER